MNFHATPPDRPHFGESDLRSAMECLSYLTASYFGPRVICANPGGPCCRIADTIRFLRRNFEREERTMDGADYPNAARHRREHAVLLRKLVEIERTVVCSEYDNSVLFGLISDWQKRHVPRFDEPFGRYLREREVEFATAKRT